MILKSKKPKKSWPMPEKVNKTPGVITLPYPPSDNNLFATFNGNRILSQEGRSYHRTVSILARQQLQPLYGGDVQVIIHIFRPIMARDVQNCMKAMLDGLTGTAWRDDKQIKRIEIERFQDKNNPRAEVTITEVGAANPSLFNF